ncbi:hypothetical protein HC028_02710 [Planosporangium flavigriseum]|nr:hypothetical protein [Planosporangium flavigriseum]NJC63426.1 hypothetical protein [Planosporangium flavigriseum]
MEGTPDAVTMLRSYLRHKALDAIAMSVESDSFKKKVVLDAPYPDEDMRPFRVLSKDAESLRGIWPYRQRLKYVSEGRALGLSEEQAHDAVMLSSVGSEIGADLVVTDCDWLLSGKASVPAVNIASPKQALALIGLLLRCRDDFVFMGGLTIKSSAWGFQWATARALLPSAWRWMSAAYAHTFSGGSTVAGALAGSCITRIARTLKLRDEIHRLTYLPHTGTRQDDLLANFDWLLVSLVAAFDVTARVADISCGLGTRKQNVAWQRADWIKSVQSVAPSLAALVDRDTPASDVLTVCRLLRNTIHNEGLQGAAYSQTSGTETRVLLEIDEINEVLEALENIGGSSAWGVHTERGMTTIEADVFVDQLIPAATQALDDLIRETPVQRLSGYKPELDNQTAPDDFHFGRGAQHRLKLLYGLP